MVPTVHISWGAVLLVGLSWTAGLADYPLVPQNGVLVLTNGNVLQGKITRTGDQYIVVASPNSEVRLPADDVELQASSLQQAYLYKREKVDGTGATKHLQLADWCIRHRLYPQAAELIILGRALDPSNGMTDRLDRLERRLMSAARTPRVNPAASTEKAFVLPPDTLPDGLPSATMARFRTTVQPVLLNGCAATTCHGGRSEANFQLSRMPRDRPLTRTLTRRNLAVTLAQIDLQHPEKSPLLTVPTRPHGGSKQALFLTLKDRRYRALADWITTLSGKPASPPAAIEPPVLSLLQTSGGVTTPTRGVPPKDDAEGVPEASTTPSARNGVYVPKDPFDPEIFNRRYHPTRRTSSQGSGRATAALDAP